MVDVQPTLASEPDAARQIALLRSEVRRLAARLERSEAELAEMALREEQLRGSFSVAMGERDKILTSKAWRLTRSLQSVMEVLRRLLSPIKRLARRPADLVAPETLPSSVARGETQPPNSYQDWVETQDSLTERDRAIISTHIAKLKNRPTFSLIIRHEDADERRRDITVTSIRQQLYPEWEICQGLDSVVTGAFVAVLEAGDILAEHALYEIAIALEAHPDAALIYTDEDSIDCEGRRTDPILKPAFSVELALGCPMTGSLAVYRRSVLEALSIAPQAIDRNRAQVLAIEIALHCGVGRIQHVPHILYHRLARDAGTNPGTGDLDRLLAVAEQIGAVLTPLQGHPQWHRVTWPLPTPLPRVTVLIPTRDRPDLLARAVLGLLYRTDYYNIEVLILDNDSIDAGTVSLFQLLQTDPRVRVLPMPGSFNYSAINNAGAREATGDILVLLNNDVDVINGDWLTEMVSHVVRPDIGAVGAKLIYSDGRIQHAGIVLGVGEYEGGPGIAGHFGHFADENDEGYLGQFALTREVSAVTGACLAVRREVWMAVGGLNELSLPVAYNDVEFCLAIRARGWRILWTPFAKLYHLESASRGSEKTPEQHERAAAEARYMRDQWGAFLDNDPFYNPNFDRCSHLFQLACQRPSRPKDQN